MPADYPCASGERFSVGSTVFLKAPDSATLPYVARVEEVTRGGSRADGDDSARVTWFYRPEEAAGGRKAFHGARELFRSDHRDTVGVASVLGLATVHSLRDFLALPRPLETDYFSRFTYAAAKQTFEPRRVPVFCLCSMPFNPDLAMLECRGPCADWFHPECLAQLANAPFGPRVEAARRAGAASASALCTALLEHEAVADGRITCPKCEAAAAAAAEKGGGEGKATARK